MLKLTHEIDMDPYRIPLTELVDGRTYEVRLDGSEPSWSLATLFGKTWLWDGEFVGRLRDTADVRVPEALVRESIEDLATEYLRLITGDWPLYEGQPRGTQKIVSQCRQIIADHRRSEPDPELEKKIQRAYFIDCMTLAEPSKPLSEIIVGYAVINENGAVLFETTDVFEGWVFLQDDAPATGCMMAVEFADGNMRHDPEAQKLINSLLDPGLVATVMSYKKAARERSDR